MSKRVRHGNGGAGSPGMLLRFGIEPRGLFILLLFASLVLLPPPAALATHNSELLGLMECYDCHALSPTEGGVEGTSHISSSSRTMSAMKSANGGTVPDTFGCTFCHRDDLLSKMSGVLDHFGSTRISKHLVGHLRSDQSPTGDTDNEYLSNNTSNTADELDCIDCHEPSLLTAPLQTSDAPYANHVLPSDGLRTANPKMLRDPNITTL